MPLCKSRDVKLLNIVLRFSDSAGQPQSIRLEVPEAGRESSILHGAIAFIVHAEHSMGGTIIRAAIENRGSEPIRLECALFEASTGFRPYSPARFFKHGYQSWSGSGPAPAGVKGPHPRDEAFFLIRINHQSEAKRPAEFPEAQTSEWFTIIESPGNSSRAMIGFASGAGALGTITVPSPDRAIARAILDGARLDPGSRREIDPLFIVTAGESAAKLAARWAEAMGRRMAARISAPYQRGWCSWYHYFHEITEDALRANLKSLEAMRAEFPIDVVQLDDGFQSALGDWDTTNVKFPSGLAKIADEIRRAGFKAGLWTAPFLAARDSRVMIEHPDWFIVQEDNGWPVQAGFNQNWTTSNDPFAYALDPSNPEFSAHLERLFAKLSREFGYSYLKLDFLYAAAAEGRRHDMRLTRAETLRRGLEAIRAGAGDDAFIVGCGCPLGPAVGIVDGMRIGPDVAPFWGDTTGGMGEPSTLHAVEAIVSRSFMHRRLWLNDPDCLMLRAKETYLTADERGALAAAIAVSGGMLLISDDMALLDREAARLFRTVAEIGEKIDLNSANEPILPLDLMADGAALGMAATDDEGCAIRSVANRGNEPLTVSVADLMLPNGEAEALDPASGEAAAIFDKIGIPSHAARIARQRR
ncbi:MAG TPA: glycoside hydrolase family 36 protein [Candidatus Binataceae bacterium]|nr:glycoside hydrolase family 36 protein [Candidatus Binataceae bacterium]